MIVCPLTAHQTITYSECKGFPWIMFKLIITKGAPGICKDSYSFVTSSCFPSWLIFCSSLLVHWFGILCCEMAVLFCDIRTTCTSLISVPSGVNTSVTQDLWKLLWLHFQGFMSWLISSLSPWQDTRLKSEWKYFHFNYFNNYVKKIAKKYYFVSLWARLSTVFHMSWFSSFSMAWLMAQKLE